MLRALVLALVFLVAATPVSAAKTYRAQRFDSRVEALPGGDLRVTETIVFRFEGGPFTRAFRVVPTRRTDGIELVSASMDGQPFSIGKGAGYINVRRKDGLNFEWQFAPIHDATHIFEVTYIVRGVVQAADGRELLAWRALPSSHDYPIDESSVDIVLPVTPGEPTVATRRVANWSSAVTGNRVRITSRGIGKNGWIEVALLVPAGALLTEPPRWQQRQFRYQSYRDRLLLVGGGVLLAGIVLLVGLRQSYDSPPRDVQAPATFHGPPEALPPAIAGALATNGSPHLEHSLATVFDLASRGVIHVNEGPTSWGVRHFDLVRGSSSASLAPHEQVVLDTIFRGKGAETGTVTLSKARSHLTMKFSKVREAIQQELRAMGLIDSGRQYVRSRYQVVALTLFALAVVAGIGVAFFFERIGPWLLTVPATFVLLGIIALIFAGAHTPLSNDGVRRAAQWRAYRKHLREVPRHGVHSHAWRSRDESPAVLLPFAVALGLGVLWSKLFRHHDAPLPPWFQAAGSADAHRSFVAFVGTGGAGAHGGTGAGGGGAAGGGASGAS